MGLCGRMLRAVALITSQSVRRQPIRSVMAVLAVAAGVSLAVGVFAAQRSAENSVLQLSSDLSGAASLRVTSAAGHGGLPVNTAERVAEVPGVQAAVPMIHTAVLANDSRGREVMVTAIGVDCRAAALTTVIDCDEAEAGSLDDFDGLVLSQRLRDELGDDGVIRTDDGRIPVRDALTFEELNGVNDGRVAAVSLPRAQELFARPSSVDSVLVVPDAGVDVESLQSDIQAAVGEWTRVGSADALFRGADAFAPLTVGLMVVGILALGIGGQLVYNTVSLSLEERRRETATLSALGGRGTAVALVVFAEAAVLGLAGGILGVVGVSVVEDQLINDLDRVVSMLSGVQLVSRSSPFTLVWCVVAGIVVAVLAAIRPARNALRLNLGTELSASAVRVDTEEQVRWRRTGLWTAAALVGVLLSWWGGRDGSLGPWQVQAAYVGVFLTVPTVSRASGLAGPVLLDAVRRLLGHRLDGRTIVVLARLTREPGRTAAMTLAVAAAVTIGIVLASFRAGMDAGAADLARADSGERVVVSTMREDNTVFIDSRPSPALVSAVADHPLVADVHLEKMVEIDLPTGADVIVATPPQAGGFEVYDGDAADVALKRSEVMIGPALARYHGARSGDTIAVPGRNGFHELAVGGVWASPSNQGFSITMTAEALEGVWGPQPVNKLHVTPTPGTSLEELAESLRSADLDPDLKAWTPEELAAGFAETWDDFFGPFDSLQQALIVMAMVAVVSTLLLVGVQRQREDGVLSAVGLSPDGLAGLAIVEAGIITAVGVALGTVSSVVMVAALVPASELFAGLGIPFRFAFGSVVTSGAVLVLAIGVASLIPAWRTSRIEVVEALQYE